MNGVIETLKFTGSNGEKYNLYPRTLIECISNKNGDNFEDTLKQYVEENVEAIVEDVVGNTYATVESVSNITNGTTIVGKATADANGNVIADTYANKTYVAEQIAAANHLVREIVTTIPTAETAKDNVIYMYKVDSATGNDVYQEYQLINGEIVLVGDTSIDLSNYVQSEELDNYLKTTGGTLNGTLWFNNGTSLLSFSPDDVVLAQCESEKDLSKAKILRVRKGDISTAVTLQDNVTSEVYPLLHTGNKPTGTYTGNGDASNFRLVATGGIGDGCIVRSSNGVAIVTGACVSILSGNSAVTDNSATWQNGELGMFSNHAVLNASGVTYTYQVL